MHEEAAARPAFIHLDNIHISPDRQRRDPRAAKPLAELKRGIASKGLFHPPVIAPRANVAPPDPQFQLVAGERRCLAIRELHADGITIHYNGAVVPLHHIPYTLLTDLSLVDLEEAELEENILRLQLPWQEEAQAKLKIHELRKSQNSDQTLRDTAQEIVEKSEAPKNIETERKALVMAQTVQRYKDTPMVKQAKSLSKAYTAVLDHEKAALSNSLRKLTRKTLPHKIIHGDFLEVSKTLPEGSFDLILSDPPYGIAANKQSFEKRHNYDDSPETALALYREILVRGWKLLKPQGTIFLFCDIEHFKTIRTYAETQLYSTWRTPLIWHKGNEGPAPWGSNGFQRTYELLFFAVKGQRPLVHGPHPDVKLFARTSRQDRRHAAEKPYELLRYLLQTSCQGGAKVLDPCAGSGPLLVAAKDLGIELTLVEKDESYYNQLVSRAYEIENSEEALPDEVPPAVDLNDVLFGDTPGTPDAQQPPAISSPGSPEEENPFPL